MECVGFIECPCARCRKRRRSATDAHPRHDQATTAYCGACRTAELTRNDARFQT